MNKKIIFFASALTICCNYAISAQVPASTASLAAFSPGKDWIEVRFLENDEKKVLYYSLKISNRNKDGSFSFPLYSMSQEGEDAFVPKKTDYTFELPRNQKQGLLVMKNGAAFEARAYIALDLGKLLTITDETEKPAQSDTAPVVAAAVPIAAPAPQPVAPPPIMPMIPSMDTAKPGASRVAVASLPIAEQVRPKAAPEPIASKTAAPPPKTVAVVKKQETAPLVSSTDTNNNEPPPPPVPTHGQFRDIAGGLIVLLFGLLLLLLALRRRRRRRIKHHAGPKPGSKHQS